MILRGFPGIGGCWRPGKAKFRGCIVKYHVTYHLWGFLGWEIQILGFKCFLTSMFHILASKPAGGWLRTDVEADQ